MSTLVVGFWEVNIFTFSEYFHILTVVIISKFISCRVRGNATISSSMHVTANPCSGTQSDGLDM